MKQYTIVAVQHTYGHLSYPVNKENVRSECEKIRKVFSVSKEKQCYQQIEVVNNETGEVREYWNNHDNSIKF